MSDVPSFMDEEKVEAVEPVEVPGPIAEPEGETTEAAPPAASEPEPKHIPISALLDERDKRQRAEREAEELRQWKARQSAEQQTQKPDFYADPDAYLAAVHQSAQALAINTKLETSRFLAEKEFGRDVVAEAYSFFDENPHLSHQLLNAASPFHEAVAVYRKQKFLREIGDDPEAWRNAERERLRQEIMAAPVQPKPTAPPPSMSSAPSATSATPTVASGFDQLFGN